jgi:arylsulfatase
MITTRNIWLGLAALLPVATVAIAPATAQQQRPNIVIIWGDDIGQSNISAYARGLMGYTTPNIDRVAKEGVMFTDYYAEQSCTAGRASFITGQSGLRTGLTKVGLPGATLGLQKEDPTLPNCSSRWATRLGNSARTILATAMNSCPRCTVSTSSTAISTT